MRAVRNTARRTSFPRFPEDGPYLSEVRMRRANEVIRSWDGYEPTPLRDLDEVAKRLGVRRVVYKDESERFGLKSFKALGGSYAIASLLDGVPDEQRRDCTIASVTDGNHGRSVAWGCRRAGCKCVIYIHEHVSETREKVLRELGAEVVRVRGNYDFALRECRAAAKEKGWMMVSDTSWDGMTAEEQVIMRLTNEIIWRENVLLSCFELPLFVDVQYGASEDLRPGSSGTTTVSGAL